MLKFSGRAAATVRAVALAVGLAALGVVSGAAAEGRTTAPQPAQPRSAATGFADLERAFWVCDHAATTRGVDGDTGILCVAITEELKEAKFGGDFDRLVAWWRERKPVEHANLEEAAERRARR
ncbi:MAG: hypothetical protein N2544_02615 [Burkholderiales bacterium]|nr:hypothetical protein [Burkholderiales bacterium]